MNTPVIMPLWAVIVIVLFAAVTFASHFLFPSVRWFFRLRAERVVARINKRLERPIEPFKLARRHDMIQQLIYHPDVMKAVTDHAAAEGVPENVAFEKALRYAREIVPSFSASVYFIMAGKVARFISHAFYKVRLVQQSTTLKDIPSDKTVVFVMNHRSNVDYFFVTYLASQQSALSYAVGEWARIWPLSPFVRSLGAYFIRRKSGGTLYRKILSRYVQMATEGGVTQAIFPEGGLSLTGDLAPPKMGLLSYVLAAHENTGRDVVFVPVAVNYDRVFEDRVLIKAHEMGSRRFGFNFGVIMRFIRRNIWKFMTFRYRKFGYAAASFGRPLYLQDWVENGNSLDAEIIAQNLMDRIGEVVPVLPVPLIAGLLLERKEWSKSDITTAALVKADKMAGGHVELSQDDFENALHDLIGRNIVSETGNCIELTDAGKKVAVYYAASLARFNIDIVK